ncbi:MAG: hypothetical protein ABFD64_00380 [Armatimonadota bacterium]
MALHEINQDIDRSVQRLSNALVLTLYVAGALLAIATAFKGPYYCWDWDHEETTFTYGSSIFYFIAAVAAYACLHIARYLKKIEMGRVRHPWLWFAAFLGFLYAACDEMLMYHERLGHVLDKASWYHHLYIVKSDDIFVLAYGTISLLFMIFLVRELLPVKRALKYYLVGVVLLVSAGMLDVLALSALITRGIEELCELYSGISFASAFIIWGLDRARLAFEVWLSSRTIREPSSIPEPLPE